MQLSKRVMGMQTAGSDNLSSVRDRFNSRVNAPTQATKAGFPLNAAGRNEN